MELLIEVVKKVADKYMDRVNLIISGHSLTLEYLYNRDGEMDLYKTLTITEFEEKLKVRVSPDRLEGLIDVSELDDIILTLDKQSNTISHTQEEIKYIREKYVAGTKIELVKMYDLLAPVPTGTLGIVQYVDDIGTVHVNWENGSTLGLSVGIDEFKVLGVDEK